MNKNHFSFGHNWKNFSNKINSKRINASIANLQYLLDESDLTGKSFLDIGCGSGLSSIAAIKLGAKVHGFDYDIESVKTSVSNLKKYSNSRNWKIEQGSVLDDTYMSSLGKFDIVYSWGVLHHTGDMWKALDHAALSVRRGGKFALAIYNDQGGASKRWYMIKKIYVNSPRVIQYFLILSIGLFFEVRSFFIRLIRFQNPLPFKDWKNKLSTRGMSVWHDLVDWVGGYPFEVAKPEEIFDFLHAKGFELSRIKTCAGGHGCNEYLFVLRDQGDNNNTGS